MLNPVFDQFVKKSPISVMARGTMERVLDPQQLDRWFETAADQQYTRELLFSTVFDIMSQVVRGSHPSVPAAYQAKKEDISVSITSVYNKLNGIEPNISADLVRYAAEQVEPIIKALGGTVPSPLPGLRILLLDGSPFKVVFSPASLGEDFGRGNMWSVLAAFPFRLRLFWSSGMFLKS